MKQRKRSHRPTIAVIDSEDEDAREELTLFDYKPTTALEMYNAFSFMIPSDEEVTDSDTEISARLESPSHSFIRPSGWTVSVPSPTRGGSEIERAFSGLSNPSGVSEVSEAVEFSAADRPAEQEFSDGQYDVRASAHSTIDLRALIESARQKIVAKDGTVVWRERKANVSEHKALPDYTTVATRTLSDAGTATKSESKRAESTTMPSRATATARPGVTPPQRKQVLKMTAAKRKIVERPPLMMKATRVDQLVNFAPTQWPPNIVHLRANYNPRKLSFCSHWPYHVCCCPTPCIYDTCPNAKAGIFCSDNCCEYSGRCGNGIHVTDKLQLVRDVESGSLGLVAKAPIAKGVVLGEYLGELHMERKDVKKRNTGFRLRMKQEPKECNQSWVYVDATKFGSILRFLNHACDATAEFAELSNGRETTIVAYTTRAVETGEEVTVHYGDDLWFICRCGFSDCVHKLYQHLQDP